MAKKLEEDRNRKESDEKVPAETFFLVIDVDKAIKENQDTYSPLISTCR